MIQRKVIVMILTVTMIFPYFNVFVPQMTPEEAAVQAATPTNQTMMQYFEWYLPNDGNHWNRLAADAQNLANLGITGIWIPPAYKGGSGTWDVGYGVYDLYDLGEFNQKGTVRTKYGTKAQLQNAIAQLKANNVKVYLDAVLNHRGSADGLESMNAFEMDWNDRNRTISGSYPITAWTKFTFPGRGNTYSSFKWNWMHFNGTDYNDTLKVNRLYRFDGKYYDWEVDTEKNNYDYLMFNDIDYDNWDVIAEMENWGVWVTNELNLDGFRLDAVKHIKFDFMKNWLNNVRARTGKNLFAVGEYWTGSTGTMLNYLNKVGNNMNLFDVDLHYRFYSAGISGGYYDMRNIFNGTLTATNSWNSMPFVDNHDSQPGQSLQSWVEPWFKPQAYAFILTRQEGIPTVFYGDYYGIPNNNIAALKTKLDPLLLARKEYAYGTQHNFIDHYDIIGWTREGDSTRPGSGLATLITDGLAGTKWMYVGAQHAGEVWKDLTGNRTDTVAINADGWGNFAVNEKSVSVWVQGNAVVGDTTAPTIPTNLTSSAKTDTTVNLSWSPSTDASGISKYEVFRNGVKIGATTTNSYSDSSLTPNTAYSYTVKAQDWFNNISANSPPFSVTTNPLNGQLVTIYYKKGFVSPYIHYRPAGGAWTASPGLAIADSEIAGYSKFITSTGSATHIEAAFNDGGTIWDNSNGLNYKFYPGTSTYTPGANNLNGTIKIGDPNTVADTTAPTVPTGLTVVSKTDSVVNLSWTASTDAVGVVSYDVFRNNVKVGSTGTTTFTNSGLTAGTTYSYTVKALDASGNTSAASAALSVTTNAVMVPNTVTIYYKRGYSKPYIHYRPVGGVWTTSPGVQLKSSEISGYSKATLTIGSATEIEASFNDGAGTWDNNKGANYRFGVGTFTYTPGALASPGMIISGKPTDVSSPTRPVGLQASAVSFSSATLNWTASTDNVGVVAYDIFRDSVKVGTSASNQFVDANLTSGTRYSYRVAARDAAGNVSSTSTALTVNTATIDIQPPTAPTGVTASAVSADSISLSWNASSDNDIVVSYDIFRNGTKVGNSTTTTYSDSGLTAATTYTYTIVAKDAYPNVSQASQPLSVTTSGTGSSDTVAPTVPSGLVASEIDADSFVLTWTASTDNDSGVKEYRVFDGATQVATTADPAFTLNGLNEYSDHTMTVRAVDFAGNVSVASAPLTVRTLSNFSGVTLSSSTVAENSPLNTVIGTLSTVGAPTGSVVTYQLVAGEDSTDNANFNVNGNQLRTTTALDFETKPVHSIRVRGTLTSGAMVEQVLSISVSDMDEMPPTIPSNLTLESKSQTTASFSWSASTDNTSVQGYDVYRDGIKIGTTASMTYSDSGLTGGTSYTYTVRAYDPFNNVSTASAPLGVTTDSPPPPNTVTIYYKRGFSVPYIHYRPVGGNWTTAPGVAIPTSELNGYNKITINIGTATKLEACFNDGGSVWDSNNSSNYLFDIGTFTYTPGTGGTPGTIVAGVPLVDLISPTTPSNVTASNVTHIGLNLNWSSSTDNVGVTGYEIFNNNVKIAQTDALTTSYVVSGLTPQTTYTFKIVAFDAEGNKSVSSDSLSVTTSAVPPSNKVTIYYKQGFTTPYAHYQPEGGNWTTAPGVAIPTSEISGFNKITFDIGTATRAQVAFNNGGSMWDSNNMLNYWFPFGTSTFIPGTNGGAGRIVPGVPDVTAPSVPGGLSASEVGANGFKVTWNASTDNVAVTAYVVYRNNVEIATVSTPSYTFTGLSEFSTHSITIRARDAEQNISATSSALSVTTADVTKPSTPSNLSSSEVTAQGFKVTWNASTDHAGIASYELYLNGALINTVNATHYVFTSLSERSTYVVTIRAKDINGNVSAYSTSITVNTLDGSAPTAPTELSVTDIGAQGFNVSWLPSWDNVAVANYRVFLNNVLHTTTPNTTLLVTGLNQNSSYVVTVRAVDAAGNVSAQSAGVTVKTLDITAPTVPSGLTASDVTAHSFKVSWTASTDNDSVDGYEVYLNNTLLDTIASTSFTFSGLNEYTNYSVFVKARDGSGNVSAASATLSQRTTDASPPTVPSGLQAIEIAGTSFKVSWTAATDNVAVSGYEVYLNGLLQTTTNTTQYIFTGLNGSTDYIVTIKAKDSSNNISLASSPLSVVTLTVTSPTDIQLSNLSIEEAVEAGSAVGELSATDADANSTFTYTLVSGAGDTDNEHFLIDGATLRVIASPDYETKALYTVRIQVSDGQLTYEESFAITVTNIAEAPSNIQLSSQEVDENNVLHAIVSILSATAEDNGATLSYSLVAGEGDTDNDKFTIMDNELRAAVVFDYETKSTYSIRVQVSDGTLSQSSHFVIDVLNGSDAPTELSLSQNEVAERVWVGIEIGEFSAVDSDTSDTLTYSLVSGEGDTDNANFKIEENKLKSASVFDFAEQTAHTIRVRVTDAEGKFYERSFDVFVIQSNALLDATNKVATIYFGDLIVMKTNSLVDLKNAITITRNANADEPEYEPLGAEDTVALKRDKIIISFKNQVTGYYNRMKIAEGALIDRFGHPSAEQVTTPLVVDVTGPSLIKTTMDTKKKILTLRFSERIFAATAGLKPAEIAASFKAAITLKRGSGAYVALADKDKVSVSGRTVQIKLSTALTTNDNLVKIAAGALKDLIGNVSLDVETPEIEDFVGPVLNKVVLGVDNKTLSVIFDEQVVNSSAGAKAAKVAALRNAITFSADGLTYNPLGLSDTFELAKNVLTIKLAVALAGTNNRIRIAANALKDIYGNSNVELTTSAIAADAVGPIFTGIVLPPKMMNRQVNIKFNERISNGFTTGKSAENKAALQAAVTIQTDEGEYVALGVSDTVKLSKDEMQIRLGSALAKAKSYRIKIATTALQDMAGNKSEEILTDIITVDIAGPRLR